MNNFLVAIFVFLHPGPPYYPVVTITEFPTEAACMKVAERVKHIVIFGAEVNVYCTTGAVSFNL